MDNPQSNMTTWHPAVFSNHPIFIIVLLPFFYLLPFAILFWWFESQSTKLSTGSQSLLYETGLLSKTRAEIRLSDIRSIRVHQTFKQRLFKIGEIAIFTTGDRPEITVRDLKHPNDIKDFIAARRLSV